MKCTQCQQNDKMIHAAMSSRERIMDWLFRTIFPQELTDITQDKYTQGFSDGLEKGRDWSREEMKDYVKKMYNIDL